MIKILMYLVKIRLVLQQCLYHARLVEFCGEVEGRIAILVLHVDVGKNVADHGYKLEYMIGIFAIVKKGMLCKKHSTKI